MAEENQSRDKISVRGGNLAPLYDANRILIMKDVTNAESHYLWFGEQRYKAYYFQGGILEDLADAQGEEFNGILDLVDEEIRILALSSGISLEGLSLAFKEAVKEQKRRTKNA